MKIYQFAFFIFNIVLIAGCVERWNESDNFISTLSCGESIEEVNSIATKFGARILQSDKRMIQIQKGVDEFLVYYNEKNEVIHVDREKVETFLFGLYAESSGDYSILECN